MSLADVFLCPPLTDSVTSHFEVYISLQTDKTEAACYACDVCTQTEVPSKKGCHVM